MTWGGCAGYDVCGNDVGGCAGMTWEVVRDMTWGGCAGMTWGGCAGYDVCGNDVGGGGI